jgi:hypothetical protein
VWVNTLNGLEVVLDLLGVAKVSCASVKVCTAARLTFSTRRSSVPSLFCAPPLHLSTFKIQSQAVVVCWVDLTTPHSPTAKTPNFRLQFGKNAKLSFRFVS